MDSNSDSGDMYSLKLEPDSDNERDCGVTKKERVQWSSENTIKLIDTMERECKELWDAKHPMNKDRAARQAKLQYLAILFGTTPEEISRKIHNLRTQFNNELRKIKRRQCGEERGPPGSAWEYFDALCFLRVPPNPLDVDGVNLALAEFQAEEEMEFGKAIREKAKSASTPSPSFGPGIAPKLPSRVAASAPPPLPPSAHPLMWPEDPAPRLRPGLGADECQIFGDFVASELRTLRSDDARKKLKRIIQKAILQIGEEEDGNVS